MKMVENEILECQDCIPSYSYIPQEMCLNMNDLGDQNYHHTQIPSDIETCDGLSHCFIFNLDEIVIPREIALKKITKRLDEMKILLGEEISDPIAIMCTHARVGGGGGE